MNNLKRFIAVHNLVRDKVWLFTTKPNPPAEKIFVDLPRTDKTKGIHLLDDQLTQFKNWMQWIEKKLMAVIFWLFIAAVAMFFGSLAFNAISQIS